MPEVVQHGPQPEVEGCGLAISGLELKVLEVCGFQGACLHKEPDPQNGPSSSILRVKGLGLQYDPCFSPDVGKPPHER